MSYTRMHSGVCSEIIGVTKRLLRVQTHIGDDAAKLGSILREGQEVTDGAADGVDTV